MTAFCTSRHMFESMVTFSGQWLLTTAHVYRASRDWLSLCYAIARARNRGKFTACHCLKIMAWLPPVSPATAQRLDSWTFPLPPYDSFGHTEIARSGRRAAPIFPHDAYTGSRSPRRDNPARRHADERECGHLRLAPTPPSSP